MQKCVWKVSSKLLSKNINKKTTDRRQTQYQYNFILSHDFCVHLSTFLVVEGVQYFSPTMYATHHMYYNNKQIICHSNMQIICRPTALVLFPEASRPAFVLLAGGASSAWCSKILAPNCKEILPPSYELCLQHTKCYFVIHVLLRQVTESEELSQNTKRSPAPFSCHMWVCSLGFSTDWSWAPGRAFQSTTPHAISLKAWSGDLQVREKNCW